MNTMLWPLSVENKAALRTALAALAAVLLSFKLHLETPYWAGMSVVIVANLYTGSIIDKAMLRIIGTVVGAFVGFYIAGLVVNSLFLYFLSCFFIVCIGAYYYSVSVHGYAYLLGALCAFIVISQLGLNPQNAFFVAIWRPVEIGIGVLVSSLSAYFIFPNHLKDNMRVQIHTIFKDLDDVFVQLSAALYSEIADFSAVAASNLELKRKIHAATELIGAMNHELGVTQVQTDEIRAILDCFYELSRQLQYLIISMPPQADFRLIHTLALEPVFSAIKADLSQLEQTYEQNSLAIVPLRTPKAVALFEQHCLQNRLDAPFKHPKGDFIYTLTHLLEHVSQRFGLLYSLFEHKPITHARKFTVFKIQERLRTDTDLIKRSIKAGLSAILALGFWMISNWPGGLNGIISSLVISVRKNLFEMRNISVHRLAGCVVGGGTALLPLFFIEMNLYDFIVLFFCSVWAFSYFMFKWPKYSYIGLQANIALIISLAQGGGPPAELAPPLQRLGGVVIGIAASFIVANLVWRSDVWTMLQRYLKKLYGYMAYNLRQVLLISGTEKVLHDLSGLFWTSRGLLEALADEPLAKKKQKKLTALRARFESLVMTQATISHILATIDCEKARSTARMFDCDLLYYETMVLRSFGAHDTAAGLRLSEKISEFLVKINTSPARADVSVEDLRCFLAYLNALNQLALRIH